MKNDLKTLCDMIIETFVQHNQELLELDMQVHLNHTLKKLTVVIYFFGQNVLIFVIKKLKSDIIE